MNRETLLNDQLLVDTVHKLKNGLGGIDGFAALLERDFETDDPRIKMVLKVQEGVRKVNEVASRLMFAVRDLDCNREEFRLTALLKQMLGDFGAGPDGSPVKLLVDSGAGAENSRIFADSQLVERMLEYVVRFIRDIEASISTVEVADAAEDSIRLRFRYQSSPDDDADSLTGYMQKLHKVEPRLDLAVINKIVSLHKGRLRIEAVSGLHKSISIELPKGF